MPTKKDPSSSRNPPTALTSPTPRAQRSSARPAAIPCPRLFGSGATVPPWVMCPDCVRSHPTASWSSLHSAPRTTARRSMPRCTPAWPATSSDPLSPGTSMCEPVSCQGSEVNQGQCKVNVGNWQRKSFLKKDRYELYIFLKSLKKYLIIIYKILQIFI